MEERPSNGLAPEQILSTESGKGLIETLKQNQEAVKEWALPIATEMFNGLKIEVLSNGYPYVRFPLTDAPEPINPRQIKALSALVACAVENWDEIDCIFSEADRGGGILLGALAEKLEKPILFANSELAQSLEDVSTPAEVKIFATPPFADKKGVVLTFNGVRKGVKYLIVDDLLSSGGTIEALVKGIQESGGEIAAVVCIGEKVDQRGREKLLNAGIDNVVTFVKVRAQGLAKTEVIEAGILRE